jgi:hypothetical protein
MKIHPETEKTFKERPGLAILLTIKEEIYLQRAME